VVERRGGLSKLISLKKKLLKKYFGFEAIPYTS
jgi:hypothetical protein